MYIMRHNREYVVESMHRKRMEGRNGEELNDMH